MLLLEPQSDVIEIGDFSKVETEIVATQLNWSPLPDLETLKVGLAEIFLESKACVFSMSSVTKNAQGAAGLIFFLGAFASLENIGFPHLNMLTVHLYLMLVAGFIMFIPMFIQEEEHQKLDHKVRRITEDLKTIKKQFPDTGKKE